MGATRQPNRALVSRIQAEEAEKLGVPLNDIFNLKRRNARITLARRRCWRRVLELTGCSVNGLATVWGCTANAISFAMKHGAMELPEETRARMRDEAVLMRLTGHYGSTRAHAIVAGRRDAAAQADIARWNALGRRSAA